MAAVPKRVKAWANRIQPGKTYPIEEALGMARARVSRPRYAGRTAAASPATGLMKRHQAEQGALIADALGHNVRDEIRRTREAETTKKAAAPTA